MDGNVSPQDVAAQQEKETASLPSLSDGKASLGVPTVSGNSILSLLKMQYINAEAAGSGSQ
jgi:hypothetical protein